MRPIRYFVVAGKGNNPLVMGTFIDMASWTAGGGGAEFGLTVSPDTKQSMNLANDGNFIVSCSNNENAGHAILGVGVDSNGNIIIKNSWGSDWQAQGLAKMSRSSCEVPTYAYCLRNFTSNR